MISRRVSGIGYVEKMLIAVISYWLVELSLLQNSGNRCLRRLSLVVLLALLTTRQEAYLSLLVLSSYHFSIE